MMNDARWIAVMMVGMTAVAGAGAATYRCLGADGKVTYGDRPCEASQQTVATLGAKGKVTPTASAASAAPSSATASAPATPASGARATPQR